MKLEYEDCGAALGVRVTGVDLSAPLSASLVDELRTAWMQKLVLVFPGQAISDECHIAFGRQFGELEVHASLAHRDSRNVEIYRVSNVDEQGQLIPPKDTSWQYLSQSWRWHTDSSFLEVPSMGSILHGIETTREGGNTRFCNLYAAYDDLSGDMKKHVEGLRVIHDHDFILSLAPGLSEVEDKGEYVELPPVLHPLVRVHPVTGKRSLFVSPHTMVGIDGMNDGTGRALLDELIDHATQPQYIYTHVWTDHDIVMWDNRCVMHSVEPFDNTCIRRVMHRLTLRGEEAPIAA